MRTAESAAAPEGFSEPFWERDVDPDLSVEYSHDGLRCNTALTDAEGLRTLGDHMLPVTVLKRTMLALGLLLPLEVL